MKPQPPSALAGGHMPLSDEESLLCEESEEDEFDLTEVVIHQVDDMCRLCRYVHVMTGCVHYHLARLQIRLRIQSGY